MTWPTLRTLGDDLRRVANVAVVAIFFATPVFAQNLLTPFPGPLSTTSGAGGGGGGGSGTVGPGVAGEVAFFTAANQVQSDAGFLYDSGTDSATLLGTMLASGGDSAATPNFFVEAGEGMYDGGADILGFATAGIERATLSATETVFNDTSTDTDFRVESNGATHALFVDAGTDRIGLFQSAPAHKLQFTAGTQTTGTNAFMMTATNANTTSAELAMLFTITGSGSGAGFTGGYQVNIASGTPASASAAGSQSLVASTGTTPFAVAAQANYGNYATAAGVGAGTNVGALGRAFGSTGKNYGTIGYAEALAGTTMSVGVTGFTFLTTGVRVGGHFSLNSVRTTEPVPTVTAALIADNGDQAADIFVVRDNATTVAAFNDGGTLMFTGVTTDITAAATQDVRIVGGTTSGSVQIQSIDDLTDFLDGAGGNDIIIQTLQGATGVASIKSSDTAGSSIRFTTSAGAFSAGALNNRAATESTGCWADTIDVNAGFVSLGCMFGDGLWQISKRQTATCAAGVLALNPTSSVVEIDANAAACVVTLAETTSATVGPGIDVEIIIVTSAGAGLVTFPDVVNIHNGPTLCTDTGIPEDGVYTIAYANKANDQWVGKSCTVN